MVLSPRARELTSRLLVRHTASPANTWVESIVPMRTPVRIVLLIMVDPPAPAAIDYAEWGGPFLDIGEEPTYLCARFLRDSHDVRRLGCVRVDHRLRRESRRQPARPRLHRECRARDSRRVRRRLDLHQHRR